MGPDGRTTVRLRAGMAGPLSPGDHVELDGDVVRWFSVVSCLRVGPDGRAGPSGLYQDVFELVLRETSPGERLAWEVMSS